MDDIAARPVDATSRRRQHLTWDYDAALLRCAGCKASPSNGWLTHEPGCSEVARLAGVALAGCPTLCDLDCDAGCHEAHQPVAKRWHQPGWACREAQLAIAQAVAAERERIAHLAFEREATYLARRDESGLLCYDSFAKLIRGQR
jgi:hypothetical protein